MGSDRIVAVVPLVGKGTLADPVRPAVIPKPDDPAANLVSFRWLMGDDGKRAIVEFAVRGRASGPAC